MKVMCGWFSMSKKSALFRWASRWSSPVVTELRSTLASTVDCSGSSAMVTVPVKSVKRPRTLLIMRWRALKPTTEWLVSTFQAPGVRSASELMGSSGVASHLRTQILYS